MLEKQKIKLSIANRVYPLTVAADQEEGARKAAKTIEVMIKQFEQSYSVRDKQDALAMCALQLGSHIEQLKIDDLEENSQLEQRLKRLNALLDSHLNS